MCDCQLPSIYERFERKSRKEHRCDECRFDIIHRGDTYTVHEGLWDGHWDRYKVCRYCTLVRAGYADDWSWDYCEPCLGELWVTMCDAGVVRWVDYNLQEAA